MANGKRIDCDTIRHKSMKESAVGADSFLTHLNPHVPAGGIDDGVCYFS